VVWFKQVVVGNFINQLNTPKLMRDYGTGVSMTAEVKVRVGVVDDSVASIIPRHIQH
jgi:hypothetical protein